MAGAMETDPSLDDREVDVAIVWHVGGEGGCIPLELFHVAGLSVFFESGGGNTVESVSA